MVDKAKHYAEDTIEISAKKKLRYSAYYRCIVAWFFVGDVSNSPLCIGGYSCLLCSLSWGVSGVIGSVLCWFIFHSPYGPYWIIIDYIVMYRVAP